MAKITTLFENVYTLLIWSNCTNITQYYLQYKNGTNYTGMYSLNFNNYTGTITVKNDKEF